jgi:hypothetical protein
MVLYDSEGKVIPILPIAHLRVWLMFLMVRHMAALQLGKPILVE